MNIAGIVLCAFFILFILRNKQSQRADYYLALLNFTLGIFLLLDLLITRKVTTELICAYQFITFLIFPFFFLYAIEMARVPFSFRTFLFVPGAILLMYTVYDFYVINHGSTSYAVKIYRYPTLGYHILYKGQLILALIGQWWFLKRITKYQREIRNDYSNIELRDLRWLKQVVIVFFIATSLTLVLYLIYNFYPQLTSIEKVNYAINGITVLALFYLSYNGVRMYAIRSLENSQAKKSLTSDEKKYVKSLLDPDVLQKIHDDLLRLMQREKAYLEPQLKLQDVAERLSVSTHSLSQTINTIEKKSFYDFINDYRVQHLKLLLSDPSNRKFSILALGLDSGFNSKASMNRIFKEKTGVAPSSYLKAH